MGCWRRRSLPEEHIRTARVQQSGGVWPLPLTLAALVPCLRRALNSGVEYYWDQLNETVFTVHSSSRGSERPG